MSRAASGGFVQVQRLYIGIGGAPNTGVGATGTLSVASGATLFVLCQNICLPGLWHRCWPWLTRHWNGNRKRRRFAPAGNLYDRG